MAANMYQAPCECNELTGGNLNHIVLCVCGRKIHRDCASLIDGAWYGPDCALRLREGEEVPQMVPGERV